MKLNKIILITSALLMGAAAYADDFDSFGDFGDFGGDSSSGSASALEVNGSAEVDIRAYVDTTDKDNKDGADKIDIKALPNAKLDLKYSGNKSDVELKLKVDEDTIKNHPVDVIDEAVLRGYFNNLTLEAGKMKVVWGKGDKLHVLDNFNADDYSDFIIPDYLDRRVSTPMVRGVISLPFANMNIEGVYTPLLPVDRFATSGCWTPAQVGELTGAVTNMATKSVADAFTRYTTATATAGGAGAAYEISKESAKKAKAGLDTATSSFNQANAAFTNVKTKYDTLQNGYKAYKAAMSSNSTLNTLMGSKNELSFEGFCGEIASFSAYTTYLQMAQAGQLPAGIPTNWDYATFKTSAPTSMNPTSQNVSSEDLEKLRKGYSEAAAAYYAATAAKQTAQTTYDGYAEAEKTAKAKYDAAEAELKSAGATYMYYLTNANALSANPDVIYPNLWTLKYSQFGGRATWTLGQIDMGVSYYNGWYKQPSFNGDKLNDFLKSYLLTGKVSENDKFLAYDKKQTFGLEASSIIWHFNVRGEFAYNLTEDTDGTDPWVHNNSIAWLGGFDIDLPFWNANLNVQETGTYILNGGKCDENKNDKYKPDVDYDKKGYTNDKIVANLTTSFLNDKVAPEVTVMYGIERGDLIVMPKLAYKPDQNLTLTLSGMLINCADEDSEFYAWRRNSFVSVGAKYQF